MQRGQVFLASFAATLASLSESWQAVREALRGLRLYRHEMDIQLAIGEVMQNIIRHGFDGGDADGRITLDIHLDACTGRLHCRIGDTAPAVAPESWEARVKGRKPEEGGIGLTLIRRLAHSFKVTPEEKGNVYIIVFSLECRA